MRDGVANLLRRETQVMTTYLQQVRQQSRQEGRQEGEQGGVRKGEAIVLLRLLRLKFGEIPDATRRRIETADADTLLTWSEHVLTAERLDDIFR
jgi:predicted transposase YdaD